MAFEQAGRAIDELSDDVGVPGVTLGVGGDMHKDMMQRDLDVAPPRHLPDRVEWEVDDRCVGDLPGAPVEDDNVMSRFLRCGPELRVGLGGVRPATEATWRGGGRTPRRST